MLRNRKADATMGGTNAPLELAEMKAELHEHRYFLEQRVERRVEHLLKRITVLESCNATLCDKLDLAHKEIAMLRQQSVSNDACSYAQAQKVPTRGDLEPKKIALVDVTKQTEYIIGK